MFKPVIKRVAPLVFSLILGCPQSIAKDLRAPPVRAEALASASSWVSAGNLNAPRYGHTATLLQNGKVLVVGGYGSNNVIVDTAELYDPAKGTWSVTGRQSIARVGHTATLLRDGRVLVVGGNSSSAPHIEPTATAELYDPGTGSWSVTGRQSIARLGHTATLLQDGKVLVAGGAPDEIYDPATGTWSPTGRLNAARYGHTATLLPNGEVLIVGGSDDGDLCSSLGSAELYNPVAGTWRGTGSLKEAICSHTATLLQNGKVLVAGGYFGSSFRGPASLNTSLLYDPVTGTWGDIRSLNTARNGHTATLLPNGEVLVAGGTNWNAGFRNPGFTVDGSELYDAGRAAWANTGSLITARSGHTATLLPNGNVLVAGGSVGSTTLSSAELYLSPGTIGPGFTGAWYDTAQSGHGLFVEVLNDNRFLAYWFTFNPAGTQQAWFGGVGTYSGNTATITEVYQTTGGRWIPNFDSSRIVNSSWGTLTFTFIDRNHGKVDFSSVAGYGTGSMNLTRLTQPLGAPSWVSTGNLNAPRGGHLATLLQNGKVLVVGGNNDFFVDTAELYDPAKGTWSVTGPPISARGLHTATLLRDGRVLVVGGDTGGGPPRFGRTGTAELYDPGTGSWHSTGSMSTIRILHTATLLQDGKVLVAGGFASDTLNTAEIYDPATGAWSPTGSLNARYGRLGHTATLLPNGEVLIAGGTDDGDFCFNLRSAELYNPAAGTWRGTGGFNEARVSHTATLLQNGKVLVAGGYLSNCDGGPASSNTSVLYDPVTGTWGDIRSLNTARQGHTATLLPNGEVLVAGGENWNAGPVSVAELYDVGRAAWANTGSLNTARDAHTATLLPNGSVLVAGGGVGSTALGSAELYGSPGIIGPGFTGAWYDPAQNGHGLFVEVLNDNRFLAYWFTFNPDGTQQAWFGGVGTYSGKTATINEVYQTTGGRWIPNFDSSRIVNSSWGTLTFTFTDCNHGKVEFNSPRGFGTGSMNLTRLTLPAGLACK